jgi:hypothetical protein
MRFLHAIWPADHIEHLAPRAALLIEGSAFQKVARLDPAKLRTKQGVQFLIESLGGQWGKLSTEEKYELFERALYTVVQKANESNDSYLARHDLAFEDLEAKDITIKDIRAYVLVRQSTMSSEDRKKAILDNGGNLTYETARKSMRLLGSKFFQDLQQSGKTSMPKKTYDAYHADENDESVMVTYQEQEGEGDEEAIFQMLADSGDEDAIYVNDFEDQIVEAIQDHAELAQCFVSYQEARARVRERARSRGFWPVKGKFKNKGGGKKGKGGNYGGSFNNTPFGRRRSLADRIANSTCRICGAAGHWKRECPQRAENRKTEQPPTNEVHFGFLDEDDKVMEVVDEIPPEAKDWEEDTTLAKVSCQVFIPPQKTLGVEDNQHAPKLFETSFTFQEANSHEIFMSDEGDFNGPKFATNLCNRLQQCSRKMRESPVVNSNPRPCLMRGNAALRESHPSTETQTNLGHGVETVFQFEEECNEAIIDTGASRAVIGSSRLKGLIDSCGLAGKVKVTPSKVVFRFGNAGTLQSTSAVFFPRKTGGWIRVEVVPAQTPFLLSNSVLRSLKAVVDVDGGMLWFKGSDDGVPLKSCRKNLMSVDFGKILELGKQGSKQEDEIHVATHRTDHMKDTDMKHDEHMTTHESNHHPRVLIGNTVVQNLDDHEEPCHVNESYHSKHAAAICPTQSVNESSTRSTTDHADRTDRHQLSRSEAPIGDQSRTDHGQESADKQCGSAPASTGSGHSPRVGSICVCRKGSTEERPSARPSRIRTMCFNYETARQFHSGSKVSRCTVGLEFKPTTSSRRSYRNREFQSLWRCSIKTM